MDVEELDFQSRMRGTAHGKDETIQDLAEGAGVDDAICVSGDHEHVVHGGFVAPGYETVRDVFLRNFRVGHQEDRAQTCAFVDGIKVVDLWASRVKVHDWGEDHCDDVGQENASEKYGAKSIQNVWSSSKAVTSIVVAILVDRGYLKYDQKVGDVWPEYACNGKEETTLIHVLRHEAGLSSLDKSISAENLTPDRIKDNAVGEIIARQKPAHPPGKKRVYHAISRGWILNEIVRRADPAGRTIGEVLKEEVTTPLGLDHELALGLPDDLHHKVAPMTERSLSWTMKQLLFPKWAGGGRVPGTNSVLTRLGFAVFVPMLAFATLLGVPSNIGIHVKDDQRDQVVLANSKTTAMEMFNRAEVRRSEVPSANCHASARALAAVANSVALAYHGEDTTLFSTETAQKIHANPNEKTMFAVVPFVFTDGGVCMFGPDRSDFVGWMGMGGSVCQWNLKERIGFGYAMNSLELVPTNIRGMRLQRQVRDCAVKLREAKETHLSNL